MRSIKIRWCSECGEQQTEPHEHELVDGHVSLDPGARLVKVAAPSEQDAALWLDYADVFRAGELPFPDQDTLVRHLGLFAAPRLVRRLLHFYHLTQLVKNVPGDWLEFGVSYGRDLAWWHCLALLDAPQHTYTQIVGFDTWEGHVGTTDVDGEVKYVQEGAFATPKGYEHFLRLVLTRLSETFPVGAGFDLWKGDVRETLPAWMELHPRSPVGFVYLDLDLYEPTRFVLETIRDRLPTGAVIGFDELGAAAYPGEVQAFYEVFGFGVPLQRSPFGDWSYLVV